MGEKRIIPQPPFRRRRETEMLAEAPAAVACVLWQYLRHLYDWADAGAAERRSLFVSEPRPWVLAKRSEAAISESAIAPALEVLGGFVREPFGTAGVEVAAACEQIARWADVRGYTETAIQFAEAATAFDGEQPRLANLSGRLTRNALDYSRAEVWLERGIGLARARHDWVEYTRGHLGAGILAMGQGREARARRHLNTASSIAMREGHEWLAAEAQHDLFQFVTVRGSYVDAEVHARRAFAWYPKHHPRFPFFVADVAFLLVCLRLPALAVPLLRRFVRVVPSPQNVLGYSLLVRGLAETGHVREYERARARLLKLLADHGEHEAAARWNLAHAEWAAGLRDEALENARRAVELAHGNHDAETEVLAARLVQALEAGVQPLGPCERRPERLRDLASALSSRLAEWSPTRRGRSPSISRADWAA